MHLSNRQEENWREIVRHCTLFVPRYKSLPENILSFPVIDRKTMLEDIGAFISDEVGSVKDDLVSVLMMREPADKLSQLRHDEAFRKPSFVIEGTSGTTGIPFLFPKTEAERGRASLAIWKFRKRLDPRCSVKTFYPFFHTPRGFTHEVDPFDCSEENIVKLYAGLVAKGITWIHGYPALLERHAATLTATGVTVPIAVAESSGAFLSDNVRDRICGSISRRVVNQYGCREVSVIGYAEGNDTFEIVTENVYVELLDDHGNRIEQSATTGWVVVTSLQQKLFPFVRYRTGDRAQWAQDRVGSSLTLMDTDRGDRLCIGGKWIPGAPFFRAMLNEAFKNTGFIYLQYIQIIQLTSTTFKLVITKSPSGEDLRSALETACNNYLESPAMSFHLEVITDRELRLSLGTKPVLFRSQITQ